MKKILSILLLGLTSVAFAGTGDALSVFNAFLSTFAKDNIEWKTDITLTNDTKNIPAGRQLGYSAMVGYYTFLPKTWDELTESQKQEVYKDPRLKSFIVSLRNAQNYPSLTSTESPTPSQASYPVEGYASAQSVAQAMGRPAMASAQAQYAPMQLQSAFASAPTQQFAAYPYTQQAVAQNPYMMVPSASFAPAATAVPSSSMTTYYFPVTIGGVIPQAAQTPVHAPLPTQFQQAYTPAAQTGVSYYMPTTSFSNTLTSPVQSAYVTQPQPTRLAITPEEMLLNRSMNVYAQ